MIFKIFDVQDTEIWLNYKLNDAYIFTEMRYQNLTE